MKSGLEGRNNELPEPGLADGLLVSMKSGLEGRNNQYEVAVEGQVVEGLNEVRPRRPEQYPREDARDSQRLRLNEVRPRRPEQWLASEGRLD